MLYSTAPPQRENRSPCFRSRSPQPAMGHPALALPNAPPTPVRPGPAGSLEGLSRHPSSLLVPPGCPRSPLDLPFPCPAFRENPLSAPGLTKAGSRGTGLPSAQRRGPSPKARLGGPQGSLGRASLSGPFGPWPQGGPQSRHWRHLDGGRGRGLHAPRKRPGKISPNPRRALVGNEQGSGGSGALRPQVNRAQGDRGDAGPVPARKPKSEGSEGAGIPSAHARHSRGSAPS